MIVIFSWLIVQERVHLDVPYEWTIQMYSINYKYIVFSLFSLTRWESHLMRLLLRFIVSQSVTEQTHDEWHETCFLCRWLWASSFYFLPSGFKKCSHRRSLKWSEISQPLVGNNKYSFFCKWAQLLLQTIFDLWKLWFWICWSPANL